MASFRDSIRTISPPWLAGGRAEKMLYAIGDILDACAETIDEGVRARFPGLGTPTALPFIAADRLIDRGFQEGDDSLAARLSVAFDTWREAGTPVAKLRALLAYVTPNAPIVRQVSNNSIWDSVVAGVWSRLYVSPLNWDWDNPGGIADVLPEQWFRIWVIMYGTGSPWTTEPTWGNGTWGDGGAWGFTATPSQVLDMRRIVGKWKAQHASVQWMIWTLDTAGGDALFNPADTFGGAGSLPDGRWGNWSKIIPGSGVQTASRSANARYMSGVT